MKIKLLTLAVIAAGVLAIGSANAANDPIWEAEATCVGGNLATGNNGHEYCQSNREMNWWSAYSWCEAQGMKLASAYDLCPTWDGAFEDYRCGTTNGITPTVWTSTPHVNNEAMHFSDNRGRMNHTYRTSNYRAACIAK